MPEDKKIGDYTLYGEYSWDDPIYKVLRRETTSPRFKLFMMQKGMKNILFYQYTDMLALQTRGGENFDDLFRRERRMLIDEGITTEPNEGMKDFFSETGTPYADLEEEDYNYGMVWCG